MQRYVSCLLQVLIGLDLCMGSKMQAKNESVCSSADINTKSVSEKKEGKYLNYKTLHIHDLWSIVLIYVILMKYFVIEFK